MPEFELCKSSKGDVRGVTQDDDERYRRFMERLEPGEIFRAKIALPRNPVFHRKFFAMLKLAFEHWEPERGRKRMKYKGQPIAKNFELFRKDMLILAGFCKPSFDARGRVHMEALSIAFDQMNDEQFARVYNAVQQVLLEHVLLNYTKDDLDRVVEQLVRFGDSHA